MQWFQFSLRRVMLLMLFFGIALASGKAAFSLMKPATSRQIELHLIYSLIAAASFGAAVGTVFRNIYNGFAIGVFIALFLCLFGFGSLLWWR